MLFYRRRILSAIARRKHEMPDTITVLHRIACVYGTLLVAYCLFFCYLSVSGALQDMRKYGGLGFSYSFGHYLKENEFPRELNLFLCVAAELVLYVVQYRQAECKKRFWGNICYFAVMLILHTAMWAHANSIPLPEGPPYDPMYFPTLEYRRFANTTVLPSIVYFVVYALRVRSCKPGKSE